MRIIIGVVFFWLAAMVGPGAFAAQDDPENTLYLDLTYGRVIIHMRPDLAPKHVARIKHLVRGGFYDGLAFHRVIEGFAAQTGDPKGKGSGGSGRTLEAEFTSTPQVRGVVSMGRAAKRNSADSQWFIVLGDNRKALDNKYTVWGEVISGMGFVDMIKKGDIKRDGALSDPDHVVRLQIAADVENASAEKVSTAALLKTTDAAETARNFSAAEFKCGALASGLGHAPQAALAQLWAHGYLAGRAQAANTLAFTTDMTESPVDTALLAACTAYPQAFLLAVASQELAKTPPALPAATAAFSPVGYTCKAYNAARSHADTGEADFVDLWGFAYIQGFKNVGQPDLEIPFEARAKILSAIAGACTKAPDLGFLDLMGQAGVKVKLK